MLSIIIKKKMLFNPKCNSFVLLITIISCANNANALIEDVIEVLKLGKDVASTLLETWELVEQTNLGGDINVPFRKEKQKKILSRIAEVSRKIDTYEDEVLQINYFHYYCFCINYTFFVKFIGIRYRYLVHRINKRLYNS